MKKYEIAIVFNAKIEDEVKNADLEKIKNYIVDLGGEIEKVDDWGKRRLAYEIKKMNEGYYYFITCTASENTPAELEARLRIMESVLRFLITCDEEE